MNHTNNISDGKEKDKKEITGDDRITFEAFMYYRV